MTPKFLFCDNQTKQDITKNLLIKHTLVKCLPMDPSRHLRIARLNLSVSCGGDGMLHVTWATFKFSRNQLETVLAYVMRSVPWSNQRAH